MNNTSVAITMEDGSQVELTITFGLLYKLRAKDKTEYERYNKIVMNGIEEVMEYPEALYTGYLCKCIQEGKEPEMTREEFVCALPYSVKEIAETYRELCNAGKKLLSEDHLKPKQGE